MSFLVTLISTRCYVQTCNDCFQNKDHGADQMARKLEHCYNYYTTYTLNEYSFHFLGAMFTTIRDVASNIKQRLAMAVQALNNIQYLWKIAGEELKLKANMHNMDR